MSDGVPSAGGESAAPGTASGLDRAVARILAGPAGQRRRGTGTLVAPGLVLTAFHVVGDRFEDPPRPLPEGTIDLLFVKAGIEARATLVDGCFDPDADWALLRCDPVPDIVPAPIATLGSGERGPDARFWTFGFPEENRREGLPYYGHVADPATRYAGSGAGPRKPKAAPAILLRADAARGDDIAGLSGGPCFVGGALVGVLRSTLTDPDELSKGHIYACPLDAVLEKVGSRLPLPDPYRGLPGLPHRPLPARPFRYLERYTEADAEIFFGRGREVRDLHDLLLSEGAPPIALFFGQTGVGKSSVLDAGLVPRLRAHREPVYVRRDATRGLLATLQKALRRAAGGVESAPGGGAGPGAAAPVSSWRDVERAVGRPVVVILDQVEEAFTRPIASSPPTPGSPPGANEPGTTELDELAAHLSTVFDGGPAQPRGRLLLSFRKEWLAEVQARLEARQLPFRKVPLWRLRANGIEDVVGGLSRTTRIRSRWGATVDPDLPRVIRDDLLSDPESPIAPTLQIVMTRLFEEADRRSPGRPALTKALYDELRRRGLLFKDFVPQQIRLVAERQRDPVESGLVDDVLEHHTTAAETSAEHPLDALKKRYGHLGPDEESGGRLVASLVEELKAAKLLSEGALRSPEDARAHEPTGAGDQRTSLAHDTLAPLVRARFAGSGLPGQRARRLLESRAVEWRDGAEGRPLDDGDLDLVKRGLLGMRAVNEDERRLIDASEAARRAREEAARAREEADRRAAEAKAASEEEARKSREAARKARRTLGLVGIAMALAAGFAGLVIYAQDRDRRAETEARKRVEAIADVEQLVTRAEKAATAGEALPLLCRAVDVLPADDPRLDRLVARAVQAAVDAPLWSADVLATAAAGGDAASGQTAGTRRITDLDMSADGGTVAARLSDDSIWVIALSPRDVASGDVLGRATRLDPAEARTRSVRVSPDGRWVVSRAAEGSRSFVWEPAASRAPRPLDVRAGAAMDVLWWSDDSRALWGGDAADVLLMGRSALKQIVVLRDGAGLVASETDGRSLAGADGLLRRLEACEDVVSEDGNYLAHLAKQREVASGSHWTNELTRGFDLAVSALDEGRPGGRPGLPSWTAQVATQRDHVEPCLRDVDAQGQRVLVGRVDLAVPTLTNLLREPVLVVDAPGRTARLHDRKDIFIQRDRGDLACGLTTDLSRAPRLTRFGRRPAATCAGEEYRLYWFPGAFWPSIRPLDVRNEWTHRALPEAGVAVGVSQSGQIQVRALRSASLDRALVGPVRAAALAPDGSRATVLGDGADLWSFPRDAPAASVRDDEPLLPLVTSSDGRRLLVRRGTPANRVGVVDVVSGKHDFAWAKALAGEEDWLTRQPDAGALPFFGGPVLFFREGLSEGPLSGRDVVLTPKRRFDLRPPESRDRTWLTGDGRHLVHVQQLGAVTDHPPLLLQPLESGDLVGPVRMPTSTGHVLLTTLLATSPWVASAVGEAQIMLVVPGRGHVFVHTQGGTAVATAVSFEPEPPPAPSTDGGAGSEGAAAPSVGTVGTPAPTPGPARVTPLVFSSHPAEGPGAFCLSGSATTAPGKGDAPRPGLDVPLLAYVSAQRVQGVRPTAPWVPVVVEDLTNGSTLATFHSTEVKAMAFSADCEQLHVIGADGVERTWHVMHRYGGEKPAWVKNLSALVFGTEIWRTPDGRESTRVVPGARQGPTRAGLLAEIRAARDQGDPSAAYVWRHWFGPDQPR